MSTIEGFHCTLIGQISPPIFAGSTATGLNLLDRPTIDNINLVRFILSIYHVAMETASGYIPHQNSTWYKTYEPCPIGEYHCLYIPPAGVRRFLGI